MDFDKWAQMNQLPIAVVDRLREEDLGNLDDLRECDEDVLKMLQLSVGQFNVLRKAVEKLKQGECAGPADTEMLFTEWAVRNKFKPETIVKLEEQELDDLDALRHVTEDDLKALTLKAGQYILVKKAVAELRNPTFQAGSVNGTVEKNTDATQHAPAPRAPDDPFVTFLATKQIREATIDALRKHGFDTVASLRLMTDADIADMGVVTGQVRLLKAAIADINAPKQEETSTAHSSPSRGAAAKEDEKGNGDPYNGNTTRRFNIATLYGTQLSKFGARTRKADEFQAWLLEKQLKQDTIEELCKMGFDSFRTLLLVTHDDVSGMDLVPGQKRLLATVLLEYKQQCKTAAAPLDPLLGGLDDRDDDTPPPPYSPPNSGDPLTNSPPHGHDAESPMDPDEGLDQARGYTPSRYHAQDAGQGRTFGAYSQPWQPQRGYQGSHHGSQQYGQQRRQPKGASGGGILSAVGKLARTGFDNVCSFVGGKKDTLMIENINGMKIVKLPLKEEMADSATKVRRCAIGKQDLKQQQKTIMLVGATGAGKSTLIDGFCNYIFDAKWTEESRFKLIDEHADELKNKQEGQSKSQTEWITVYTITSGDSNRLPYTLNLIDTPGFGDTRGIKRDQMLVDQIRVLFGNPEKYGIDSLDAVCFLAKAPDARLTHTQRYIFDSILSIFGNDVGDNILVMITFADGAAPPVLEAIKAAKLPHRKHFRFNNSALFANNGQGKGKIEDDSSDFTKMFWDMGEKSFAGFFQFLTTLDPKSLNLTKQVLEERQNLKDTLDYIEKKIHKGLATMSKLRDEERIFQLNEQKIKDNKDFNYTVTEMVSKQVSCDLNRHVTHCMNCHHTCHDDCAYRDDADKASCVAMGRDGHCERCTQKCHWSEHKNSGYYLVNEAKQIQKTYKAKQQEYERATGLKAGQINVIEMIKAEYMQIKYDVENDVKKCRGILQRLRQIALKPDPLSEVEYIDMLIQAERDEHKVGWEARVRELQDIKSKARRLQDVHTNKALLADA